MFLSTLLTMFISTITLLLGMFVDGLVIGNFLELNDMAAYGLITPISSILLAISGVFSSGTQLIATKYMGSGKKKEAQRVFTFLSSLLFLTGVVLMIIFIIFAPSISAALGATGDLSRSGNDYFLGLAFETPFLMYASMMAPFLQLDGAQKTAVIAVAALTLSDLLFDIISASVLHMGMYGIGLSTSLSSMIAFAIVVTHFRKKDAIFRPYFHGFRLKEALQALLMGLPTAASRFFATFRTMGLNFILLMISTNAAVAAFSVRTNLGMVFASVGMAIGMATLTITGVLYAEEDRTTLSRLFKTGIYYSVFLNVIIMAGLLIFADLVVNAYMQPDPEACALAARSLRFCAVRLPFYSINNMLTNYLQATHRLKAANILMFLQSFLVSILFALLFSGILGTDAVWASYIICELVTTAIYIAAASRKKHEFTMNPDDLLLLPDGYGVSPEDKMEGNINSMDEVFRISRKAAFFMRNHGIDDRRIKAVSESLEELGSNVIKFGFADGGKHALEYRILIKKDTVIFRLRDDCPLFDPVKHMNEIGDLDPVSHAGTSVLFSLAKKVSYMNTMAMNNLLVVL